MEKEKWRPQEKPHQKLLVHVDEKMKLIHQGLQSLYMGSDKSSADVIHGVRMQVYYLRDIFFDLLFDEKPAKEILQERRTS